MHTQCSQYHFIFTTEIQYWTMLVWWLHIVDFQYWGKCVWCMVIITLQYQKSLSCFPVSMISGAPIPVNWFLVAGDYMYQEVFPGIEDHVSWFCRPVSPGLGNQDTWSSILVPGWEGDQEIMGPAFRYMTNPCCVSTCVAWNHPTNKILELFRPPSSVRPSRILHQLQTAITPPIS